jgi:hypothetical protein
MFRYLERRMKMQPVRIGATVPIAILLAGAVLKGFFLSGDIGVSEACTMEEKQAFEVAASRDSLPYSRYYLDGEGICGIARFLMRIGNRDPQYNPYFRGGAQLLMNMKREEGNNPVRYCWPKYQGYEATYEPRAIANIGMFFLQAYQDTADPVYLEHAEGAANWLISVCQDTLQGEGGFWWLHEPAPGHAIPAEDSVVCYGRMYGITYIGHFLFEMWKEDTTDLDTYLPYVSKTAKFLMSVADTGRDAWMRGVISRPRGLPPTDTIWR